MAGKKDEKEQKDIIVEVPGSKSITNRALLMAALSQGQTAGGAGLPVGGKMMVFCGLERELDDLLAALHRAGIVCLKAVLTPSNRNWTPGRLYQELERERRAMGGR